MDNCNYKKKKVRLEDNLDKVKRDDGSKEKETSYK